MKNYIILLLLIFVASQAFSQKKEGVDPKDLKIDSLTKVTVMYAAQVDSLTKINASLSVQLDSVSKDCEKYYGLYVTIKEKVLKRDFDPAKFSQVIDSLVARRDSTFLGLSASSASLMDSLSVLQKENMQFKASLAGIMEEEAARNRLVNELKQLKELLDSQILTLSEFTVRKSVVLQKWK